MWRHDLVRSLLGHADNEAPERDRPLELSGVPSWSWASIDQPVCMPRGYGGPSLPRPLIEVEKVEVTNAGNSTASQILSGSLHVHSILIRATHTVSDSEDQGRFDSPIALLRGPHEERRRIGRA